MEAGLTEALKACLVLNAGSVVAMLGFLQNVLTKGSSAGFKPYALGAASAFLLGAVFVILAFGNRSATARAILKGDSQKAESFDTSSMNFIVFSIFLFILGAVIAGAGMAITL
ncbi:Sec-independent protein secretion pathway component TatC [Cupriavidus metallidurans]